MLLKPPFFTLIGLKHTHNLNKNTFQQYTKKKNETSKNCTVTIILLTTTILIYSAKSHKFHSKAHIMTQNLIDHKYRINQLIPCKLALDAINTSVLYVLVFMQTKVNVRIPWTHFTHNYMQILIRSLGKRTNKKQMHTQE